MDYQLTGQLAYVSAGAHGIGEAIADLLTQEGAEVIVADADADVLQEKAGKWRGTVAADLATPAGVEKATGYALKQFGRAPDILINNLGVGNSTPFEDSVRRALGPVVRGEPDGCRADLPGAGPEDG